MKNSSQSPFPVEVIENFENPILVGKDSLWVFAFHVYDIKNFTEKKFGIQNYRDKFAINIKYNRSFSKAVLIESSIDEMKRIDNLSDQEVEKYQKFLAKIFVDVKKGDEKTALIDQNGIKLFYNHKLIGAVEDRVFALSFADIWLSDKARYPKVRKALLAL